MVRLLFTIIALCSLAGCELRSAVDETDSLSEVAEGRVYGALQRAGSLTPLSEITANPRRYQGQQIRTEGEVQRVCQRRGCWLELADATGARAFVPMAGHAFTVPMDSVGQRAVVEGTVQLRQRSQAELDHLASDGAGKTIPAVSIEATGVLVPHG